MDRKENTRRWESPHFAIYENNREKGGYRPWDYKYDPAADTFICPRGRVLRHTTTRAQLVMVIWRMEGSPEVDYDMTYTDVNYEVWYIEAVRWVTSKYIIDGYGDGCFGPDNPITREQLATVLYRYTQYKGYDNVSIDKEIEDFEDYGDVSSYAQKPMEWAVDTGIIKGVTDTTLELQDASTRG